MHQCDFAKICLFYGCFFFFLSEIEAKSHPCYWQQEVKYNMDIKMDVHNNQFTGIQTIKYKNNAPESLTKIFFHLYLNAFQPGSVMDVRSQASPKAGMGIGSRISRLMPHEIGYQHITKLTINGVPLSFEIVGTILEATLSKPIKPGQTVRYSLAKHN